MGTAAGLEALQMLTLVPLFFAALLDIRTGKIPDWLTYGTMFYALVAYPTPERVLWIVIALLICYPLYRLGVLGGGDVKLAMALSALVNPFYPIVLLLGAAVVYVLLLIPWSLSNPRFWRVFSVTSVAFAVARAGWFWALLAPLSDVWMLPLALYGLVAYPAYLVGALLFAHILTIRRKGTVRLAPALFFVAALLHALCCMHWVELCSLMQ